MSSQPSPVTVYGPYYRLRSETQTSETARKIVKSGELWGGPPRNSDVAAVQAHRTLHPEDVGMEIYTFTPPDSPFGNVFFWRERQDGTVWLDGDVAKIKVLVSRVDQDF